MRETPSLPAITNYDPPPRPSSFERRSGKGWTCWSITKNRRNPFEILRKTASTRRRMISAKIVLPGFAAKARHAVTAVVGDPDIDEALWDAEGGRNGGAGPIIDDDELDDLASLGDGNRAMSFRGIPHVPRTRGASENSRQIKRQCQPQSARVPRL